MCVYFCFLDVDLTFSCYNFFFVFFKFDFDKRKIPLRLVVLFFLQLFCNYEEEDEEKVK